ETGEYYLKGGADSPENFLGYWEFDQTFDNGGLATPGLIDGLHRFEPHVQDWNPGDPTWQGDKGRGIIGALNYLSGQGMNSVYFLTFNVAGGDGEDTWPWTSPTERLRYDCSKLDQWEVVFTHMDHVGIQLHVVTQETENDQNLDGGNLGLQRKLYYRELVARFGHHHALIWNLGEENSNSNNQRKAYADYIRALDVYEHPITVHTFFNAAPGYYDDLYGHPTFEATSLQGTGTNYNDWAVQIRELSASAGRKWAIFGDEQGPRVDDNLNNLDTLREGSLWGNLMGGGAGVEWYYGYQGTFGDVQSEDWRDTEGLWEDTKHALDFFQSHLPFEVMEPANNLVTGSNFCLALPGEVYAVYLPGGGSTTLDLQNNAGSFTVRWYNPREGGGLQTGSVTTVNGPGTVSLGNPPSNSGQDWVVLVERN
ncbi:MAG: putative collagen-binding domain-containing protein, partial [Phycisphaerae bacterium]